MTYALKRASSMLIKPDNWEAFEAHVCHVALSHPNTLQTVAQIFATYKFHGYKLNSKRIQRTLNTLIAEHSALGHHSEVAWGLWMCKELDIKLEQNCIDLVAQMQSSVCALILMDLSNAGRLDKAPKEQFWRSVDACHSTKLNWHAVCCLKTISCKNKPKQAPFLIGLIQINHLQGLAAKFVHAK